MNSPKQSHPLLEPVPLALGALLLYFTLDLGFQSKDLVEVFSASNSRWALVGVTPFLIFAAQILCVLAVGLASIARMKEMVRSRKAYWAVIVWAPLLALALWLGSYTWRDTANWSKEFISLLTEPDSSQNHRSLK